jgi:hypothetical protein
MWGYVQNIAYAEKIRNKIVSNERSEASTNSDTPDILQRVRTETE